MNRLLAAAAAATVTFLATAPTYATPPKPATAQQAQAQALEHSAAGIVASYSADTRMLKLQSGSEFKLAQTVNAHPRQGDRVTVRWAYEGQERIADRVMTEP